MVLADPLAARERGGLMPGASWHALPSTRRNRRGAGFEVLSFLCASCKKNPERAPSAPVVAKPVPSPPPDRSPFPPLPPVKMVSVGFWPHGAARVGQMMTGNHKFSSYKKLRLRII